MKSSAILKRGKEIMNAKRNILIEEAARELKAGMRQQRENIKRTFFSEAENKFLTMQMLGKYYADNGLEIPSEVINFMLDKSFHLLRLDQHPNDLHPANYNILNAACMVCGIEIETKEIIRILEVNKKVHPAYSWFSHVLKIASKEQC